MTYFESKLLKLWQFFFCLRMYGLRNALLMTDRVGSTMKRRIFRFKTDDASRAVMFKVDLGVLSHFYKEGFYIRDTADAPVRTILSNRRAHHWGGRKIKIRNLISLMP